MEKEIKTFNWTTTSGPGLYPIKRHERLRRAIQRATFIVIGKRKKVPQRGIVGWWTRKKMGYAVDRIEKHAYHLWYSTPKYYNCRCVTVPVKEI